MVQIAIFTLYYVFNLLTHQVLEWIPTLIFVALIIFSVASHAKAMQGNARFGDLFVVGFRTTAISTLIYILFLAIFIALVPAYKEAIMEMSRQRMEAQGSSLTSDQINTALQMVSRFFVISVIGFGAIGNVVVGAISSLIGAAISKKKTGSEPMV